MKMARLIGGSMVSAAGVDLLVWRLGGPASTGTYRPMPVLMGAFGLVLLFLVATQLKSGSAGPVSRRARARLWALWTLGCALMPLILAMPRMGFIDTREGFYRGLMRSHLGELVAAEDSVRADSGSYTANPALTVRPGIRDREIALTADGWTARVRHGASAGTCAVFVGSTAIAPARVERQPACTKFPLAGRVLISLALIALGFVIANAKVRERG